MLTLDCSGRSILEDRPGMIEQWGEYLRVYPERRFKVGWKAEFLSDHETEHGTLRKGTKVTVVNMDRYTVDDIVDVQGDIRYNGVHKSKLKALVKYETIHYCGD